MALRSIAGPATAAASNSNRRVFCDENADVAAVNGRKAAAVGGFKVKAASAAAGGMVLRQSVRAPLACLSNKAEQAPVHGKLGVKTRQPKVGLRRQEAAVALVAAAVVLKDEEPMDLEELELEEGIDVAVEGVPPALCSKTPPGVRDIDTEDLANPQLCGEYAKEMYCYLQWLEAALPVQPNYLAGCLISSKMRSVLVDWLVDVQQQFKLLQETLFLSVDIIDRFLQVEGKSLHRTTLQLVGITAMFIASKYEEIYAPEIEDFVYITDNAYTASELRAMEGRILCCLDFALGRPIAINFLRRFSKAGDVDVVHHTLAKYILEGTLLDYSLVSVAPSLTAAVSLYLAILLVEQSEISWDASLEFYSGYTKNQVQEKICLVAESFKRAIGGKLVAVRTKYSSSSMLRISEMQGLQQRLSLL